MTMGFGDMDIRLPQQRKRFTPEGWEAFNKAFVAQKIGETFKQSQLVLTTVPSDTPVIIAQGPNAENIYQWIVQMPVIMTYATNNNAMRKERAFVTLTIVRVPADESSAGIAIQSWHLTT
jgi:intracellular multiplication protein IcmL